MFKVRKINEAGKKQAKAAEKLIAYIATLYKKGMTQDQIMEAVHRDFTEDELNDTVL